jgi:hypothetical protein
MLILYSQFYDKKEASTIQVTGDKFPQRNKHITFWIIEYYFLISLYLYEKKILMLKQKI